MCYHTHSSLQYKLIIPTCIPDTPLGRQTITSYKAALSDQSHTNRIRQAEYYLTFALHYGVDILHPTTADACLYIQFLANSLASPLSVKNYACGARLWITDRGGDASALLSKLAKDLEKGIIKLSSHTPAPAPPLMPSDLVKLCLAFDHHHEGPTLKAALTMGYFGFLRTSNLLSPSATLWGGPHTLRVQDVLAHATGLILLLRSSKTIKAGHQPGVLALPRIPTSLACPTKAWEDYIRHVNPHPMAPAFLLTSGVPLSTYSLMSVIRSLLQAMGCPYAILTSSHSLRRGGAQAAQAAGAHKEAIMDHGTWKTVGAMSSYVPKLPSPEVANSLAALFTH